MLNLESWASGSILTGGKIFYWPFLFSHSKASDANNSIIANFVQLRKNSITQKCSVTPSTQIQQVPSPNLKSP